MKFSLYRNIASIMLINSSNPQLQWSPWSLLHPEQNNTNNYAIIILNTPIQWKKEFVLPFWCKAAITVLVDGGANQWNKWLKLDKMKCACNIPEPTLVTGDMDSIDKEFLEHFKKNGSTKVVFTPDQNETDFTKSLREIQAYMKETSTKVTNIIAFVGTCGRMDQIMANIQTLYHCQRIFPEINLFLLGSNCLSWLLKPGKHKIEIPEIVRKTWCALIPVGQKCKQVTTTGLKWDLNNQSLSFGELVSTSNTYSGLEHVTIENSDPIFWSMGLKGIPTDFEEL